jgi:hypothetical protein
MIWGRGKRKIRMKDKTLKVASILLIAIVAVLIYRVSILEKKINEYSETLEILEGMVLKEAIIS